MASDTKNVKLGVCKITLGGVDLGYTMGGVDVTVKTETHKVTIDQFGKTPINEYIMGRTVEVKAPLAETTLFNLGKIMPGCSVIMEGASIATGIITIATLPTNGQTIIVNGRTITFKTLGVSYANEVTIGASVTTAASALAALINASSDSALNAFTAIPTVGVVALTSVLKGVVGNAYTLVTGTAGVAVTMSGATFTGGIDGTIARVDVSPNVGVNLLDYAQVLVLHPIAKAATDTSDDFTMFKTAAGGDINFSYKLDSERVYTATFAGYPDSVTGKIFAIGDILAP